MALLLVEGFDGYSAVEDAYWPSATTFSIETTITNSGRASLKIAATTTLYMPMPFGGESNEIYIGFAFRTDSLPWQIQFL